MKKWIQIFAICSIMGTQVFAQTAEKAEIVPAPAEDSHTLAVEELLVAMRMNVNVNKTIDQMMSMQTRVNPDGSAVIDATREFYEKYLNWDAQKGDIVKLYQETFTEDEIRQMTAFYQTPVGQKVIETMPELSSKAMKITMERMAKHMKELREVIAAARVKDGLPADGRPQLGPFPPKNAPKGPLSMRPRPAGPRSAPMQQVPAPLTLEEKSAGTPAESAE